jgi:hypothetical protein
VTQVPLRNQYKFPPPLIALCDERDMHNVHTCVCAANGASSREYGMIRLTDESGRTVELAYGWLKMNLLFAQEAVS